MEILNPMDAATLSAIVIGITQLVKKGKYVDKRHLPAVAVITGGLVGLIFTGFSLAGLAQGLIAGFVTAGLVNFIKEENKK